MKLLSALFMATGLATASLVDDGQVVTLDGIKYYVGGISVGKLSNDCARSAVTAKAKIPGFDIFPMTIMETSGAEVTPDQMLDTAAAYDDADDVFQPAFLRTIYMRSPEASQPAINATLLTGQMDEMNAFLVIADGGVFGDAARFASGPLNTTIPRGPVFVSATTGDIYKAHRLYDDDYLAFIQGVVDDEQGGYYSLPAVTENVMAKSVAVPSRLYSVETEDKPLAGLRLGVKDIYHVKGIATSGGSRSYFYLYGTQNETAPSIQRLIDLGAVLVGKMGTVQFANGDTPTADWVDLHCPFNPRGDGYQLPSGSSTGPGAGMGAYVWLDMAVGSDTGGSMRGPAGAQGLFGNRPSTGAISMDNVIPLSPVSDTAGAFARSGKLWAKITQAWYPDMATNYTSYPSQLYRSPVTNRGAWDASTATPEARRVIESFYERLEDFLNVSAVTADYTQDWADTHTQGPDDVQEMLYSTYGVFVSHDQWQLLGQPMFEKYAAENDGRQPYINPGPLRRWQWGQENATDAIYAQALSNITIFKDWYETEGYGRTDPESCSETLYSYIWSAAAPSYRDVYFGAPTAPPLGFDDSSIPVMAGAPEVVVPIGEATYNSTKSLHEEYLPITVALRMARGCDFHLATLVSDLEESSILNPVATGKRLYPEA